MKVAHKDDLLVIGVDVSKAKLDLAWGSNGPLETIDNTEKAITRNLIAKIKDPVHVLIVMEGSGG